MPTTNMSLNKPSVGQTAGPDWATEVNENFEIIDQHDHTSGKGVQLTPSALNINSDLEFNGNAAIELKRLTFDSSATGSGTNFSIYQLAGNLYWYNGSGQAVQITNGPSVKTTGGSIDNMAGTDAGVDYGAPTFRFQFDTTLSNFGAGKIAHGDILLYKYDGSSGSNAYVILKYTGSSEGSNNLTFPDETGTLLSTATSFGGAISISATGGSGSITLDAAQDINLDSDTGVLTFKDNGTAIGKISNSSSDLVIENEVDAKDIIFKQYDGNEVVRMADDRRLYFFDKGGEYIVGDGTDLTVASGADINLTATADVNLPNNVGLVFGDDGEKIEGDGTDLTIASSGEINVNSGTLDLSAQTVDVTLNNAVDALNFDSNTLSIDASNNRIGIGTAAPVAPLQIDSNSAGDAALLRLQNRNNTDGDTANILFGFAGNNNANKGGIFFKRTASYGRGSLIFATENSASNDNVDNSDAKLTIDSSGNVGIGTTLPQNEAHIHDSSGSNSSGGSSYVQFTNAVTGATDNDGCVVGINGGSDPIFNIWNMENSAVRIATNSTVRLTVDSSGLVGLGGVTPESILTLPAPAYNVSDTGGMIRWQNQDTDHGSDVCIQGYNVDTHGCEMYIGLNSYVNTGGSITRFHSTEELSGLLFGRTGNIGFYTANTSGSPTGRFQIDNIGNVGIGVTPANVRLYIKGAGTDSSAYATFLMNGGGTNLMYVRNDGYTWAYQAWATSDRRKKKNINYINEDILPKIEKLKLAKFDYTDIDSKNNYGFIAQDVEEIFPECISDTQTEAVLYQNGDEIPEGKKIGDIMKEKDEQKNLNYNFLFSHLVKAVQELSAKVTTLENA